MREIVLDPETTGLNYKAGDRVIEVGCVELTNYVRTNNSLQFYCSVDKKITESATKIHGLTNKFLNPKACLRAPIANLHYVHLKQGMTV